MNTAPILGPIGELARHAQLYAKADYPIFPVNPTNKTPLVSQHHATTNPDQITKWWQQWPNALIGHRLNPDTIILDIDPRHGGHNTWKQLAATTHIPPTRHHLSGRQDGGGHTWWQRPPGKLTTRKLDQWAQQHGGGHQTSNNKWTAGIDILRHEHRYTILPPSPHPDTGKPYQWQPGQGLDRDPQPLPPLLVELLVDNTPEPAPPPPSSRTTKQDSILDWYNQTHTWTELLGRHGWTLTAGDGNSDGSRWRHPTATAAHSATIRHGCLFVYSPNTPFDQTGTGDAHGYTLARAWAILEHNGNLTQAAKTAHRMRGDSPETLVGYNPTRDTSRRNTEQNRGQSEETTAPEPDQETPVRLPNLPQTLWDSRPELATIQTHAHHRAISADALLGSIIARTLALTPPAITLPPIIGAPAALNIATAIIGPAGTGKSTSANTAQQLLPTNPLDKIVDMAPIGSGEGLIELYMGDIEGPDGKNTRGQTRTSALVYVDEGATLAATAARKGTTTWPTIRTMISGATAGQSNATTTTTRILHAGHYRFALIVGWQPETATQILTPEETAAGTPARFIFYASVDPAIPDNAPPQPKWNWQPPPTRHLAGPHLDVHADIANQIRNTHLARLRGETTIEAIDGHRHLNQLKTAAALAILNQRWNINPDDWQLAGIIIDNSDNIRRHILDVAAQQRQRAVEASAARAVLVARRTEDDAANRARTLMARTITRHVHRHYADTQQPCTSRCIAHATASKHRRLVPVEEAIDEAVTAGGIETDGGHFRPTGRNR